MKSESIVFGVAGAVFGLMVGWMLGSQQAGAPRSVPAQAPAGQTAGTTEPQAGSGQAALFDETQAQALRTIAERDPANVTARVQLGNMNFDAERYPEAIRWYEDALKLNPRDVNVSTDLGVSYYYSNQADRALKQFDHSLSIDPKHMKTLLNLGIVRAFGKQDLEGAAAAWQQVIKLAPDSPEGQAAKRALDSMRSAHPGLGAGAPARNPTGSEP